MRATVWQPYISRYPLPLNVLWGKNLPPPETGKMLSSNPEPVPDTIVRTSRHPSIYHYLTVFRCEATVGRSPLRINRAMLLWSRLRWGFLRALSESQFLRSKNGRVAQQPAQPAEQWPIRRGLRPTVAGIGAQNQDR